MRFTFYDIVFNFRSKFNISELRLGNLIYIIVNFYLAFIIRSPKFLFSDEIAETFVSSSASLIVVNKSERRNEALL